MASGRFSFTALKLILTLTSLWGASSSRRGFVNPQKQACNTQLQLLRHYDRGSSNPSALRNPSRQSQHSSSIPKVVGRKYRKPSLPLANLDIAAYTSSDEPSIDELRAQLGPIGLFVSNTIELTVITLGSILSGGLLGYFGGGILNLPSTLFDKNTNLLSKFGVLHSKAWGTCKQWGMLSGAFSGFNNLVRMVRGEREDRWNAVWGSALTGAFLNRSGEFFVFRCVCVSLFDEKNKDKVMVDKIEN
jgi:hypothetical protein